MKEEQMIKEVKERRRQWLTTRTSDFEWLIEQAERAEIYKKALMEIGAKFEPPASRVANDALYVADYLRNK